MLIELDIAHFKLLRETHLTFHGGLTAITGETGVGKSMLLGALAFLLGEKAPDEARVSGAFALDPTHPSSRALTEEGLWDPAEDAEFLLERSVAPGGRSRAFLNGRRLSQSSLTRIGELLCDLLGQHQVRYLTRLDPLVLLDSHGDAAHQALASEMREAYAAWRLADKALGDAKRQVAELAEKREYLAFQHQELSGAHLQIGEEEALGAEQSRLSNVAELRALAASTVVLLTEGSEESQSAYQLLAEARVALEQLADLDGEWRGATTELGTQLEQLQELARSLARYAEGLEADPGRLAKLDKRIAQLEALKRKYRMDYAGLCALADQVAKQLEAVDGGEESLAGLEAALKSATKAARGLASQLHESRLKLAPTVAEALRSHLADLSLSHARVEFQVASEEGRLHAGGSDRVELLLSTHPREALQPFRAIASGGEVTRLALAFKALQTARDGLPLLVIDEGDLGIGGDTAFRVGAKFRSLSATQQVLVVSHLPQVAAYAAQQLAISKDEKTGHIAITSVEGESRVGELARMLGQSTDPSAAKTLASSYLEQAQGVGKKAVGAGRRGR